MNWDDLVYMQDMTPEACASGTVSTTTSGDLYQKQLIDKRDGKKYWVAKLQDNHCWMTQNLAINLTNRTLTPADSDVANNWSGTLTWGTAANTVAWQISNTGSEHTSYGGYYTWQAATAGTAPASTGEAASSICPKGWRLPSNSSSQGPTFAGLTSAYNISSNAAGVSLMQDTPLYFVLSGVVSNGSLNDASSSGYYWSSTASSATHAYALNFSSSNVYPSNGSNRYFGRSVRCVAR